MLAVTTGVLLIIAAWRNFVPMEPAIDGKPLSEWFTENLDPDRAALKRAKPDPLPWLIYQTKRAYAWDALELGENPSAMVRFRIWWNELWHGAGPTKADVIHFEAICALGRLGPDAASAVPALLEAARDGAYDDRLLAAFSLQDIGAPAWPAVAEVIRNGTWEEKAMLIYNPLSFPNDGPPPTVSEFVQLFDLLTSLYRVPNAKVRAFVRGSLSEIAGDWFDNPKAEEGIRLVAERLLTEDTDGIVLITDVLRDFGEKGTVAAPALTALLTHQDLRARAAAAVALADVNPDDPRAKAVLMEIKNASDEELATLAEEELIRYLW